MTLAQIAAIISLLVSFNVDPATVVRVQTILYAPYQTHMVQSVPASSAALPVGQLPTEVQVPQSAPQGPVAQSFLANSVSLQSVDGTMGTFAVHIELAATSTLKFETGTYSGDGAKRVWQGYTQVNETGKVFDFTFPFPMGNTTFEYHITTSDGLSYQARIPN